MTDGRGAKARKRKLLSAEGWIRKHCSIMLHSGVKPLKPYPYQAALWRDDSRQRIVLKSRQMGVSRAVACEALYTAVNVPGTTVLFVSRSLQAARNLMRYAWQSVGPAIADGALLKPTRKNTTELEWEQNDSRVVSLAASEDAARSYSATAVYLDEAAYLPYAEEIYQSLAPTVSNGGRITVLSTPHGRGNLFHRLWECEEGWSKIRIHWSERPEYTPDWAEKERQRHTERSWAEEYELSFEQSGASVFSEDHVRALLATGRQAPAPPYFAGLDLARYTDYTALAVLDSRGQLITLERFNQAGWTIQVERVAAALRAYPGCRVVCDATSVGDPVFEMLQKKACENQPQSWFVEPFLYTSESRAVLMELFVLAVEQAQIHIPNDPANAVLLGEMRAFQWEQTPTGRIVPRHPVGGHDDCVQALALAWRALYTARTHPPRTMPALIGVDRAGPVGRLRG